MTEKSLDYRQAEIMASEAAGVLAGKTIAEVKTYVYMEWPCIEEIVFTDGTVLSLWGAADCAIISDVEIK